MPFEELFEDLEAQFEAAQNWPTAQLIKDHSAIAEVQDLALVKHRLVAPLLGQNFIAGLDKTLPIWNIFPFTNVRQVRFLTADEPQLPRAREVPKDMFQHLRELAFPIGMEWSAIDDASIQPANLLGIAGQLLMIQGAGGLTGVPVARVALIRFMAVDNFS